MIKMWKRNMLKLKLCKQRHFQYIRIFYLIWKLFKLVLECCLECCVKLTATSNFFPGRPVFNRLTTFLWKLPWLVKFMTFKNLQELVWAQKPVTNFRFAMDMVQIKVTLSLKSVTSTLSLRKSTYKLSRLHKLRDLEKGILWI